jgi:hypothetical protein
MSELTWEQEQDIQDYKIYLAESQASERKVRTMETKKTHGGARPKAREDDGRTHNGGARDGAGRPQQRFMLRLGQKVVAYNRDRDGKIVEADNMGNQWTVEEINGNEIILRKPDGGTILVRR